MLGEAGITEVECKEDAASNALKRGELHVHMNGAVPAVTVWKIFADEGTSLPQGFDFERNLVRLTPCRSLAEYLTPWQILRLFPKKRAKLDRLTLSVFNSLAENQVVFVELRSSLLYLAMLQGCSPAQALERLIESTGEAARYCIGWGEYRFPDESPLLAQMGRMQDAMTHPTTTEGQR